MLDSLVRVSRRVGWNHFVSNHWSWYLLLSSSSESPLGGRSQRLQLSTQDRTKQQPVELTVCNSSLSQKGNPVAHRFPRLAADADMQSKKHCTDVVSLIWWSCDSPSLWNSKCTTIWLSKSWSHTLSFQQVQALLALFSKSFSSFPHGTCVLSVSNWYWALDGIYHLLCAPIPRNVTFRKHTVHKGLQMTNGTLTLSGTLFQEAFICTLVGNVSTDNTSRPQGLDSQTELFLVHSPLLKESCLVSIPPLTYMLKFSGCASLNSCLDDKLSYHDSSG